MLSVSTSRPAQIAGSILVFGLLATPILWAQGPELVARSEAKTPAEEVKGFKLPKGLTAQLVASEPDIHKPMNIAWDDQGRLWVTSTLEYPYPAKDPAKARDKVHILSDFGPDGKARNVSTFAEGLNIPIGLLPLPGNKPRRALVFQINQVLLLEDTDGDGKADKREPILTGYGFVDTHGMTNAFTLAPDGWIYATHGFANQSEIRGKDGRVLKLQSGNTYRFRPDGTGIEAYTRGQVNPFGLAMDRWGHFYTADCHSRPVYALLRGAYYPSFGKPHDGLGFGPEMCFHDHGSTGIAGCLIYSGDLLADQCKDQIFLGNVVTSRLNRDRIDWTGASPKAVELPDLIVSEDPWFRPVDIKTGPDGAIYIADFYNRIIGHYEVPLTHPGRDRHRGRIWRIVPEGFNEDQSTKKGDLTQKSAEEMISLLGNSQWDLAVRATFTLEGLAKSGAQTANATLSLLEKAADTSTQGQARSLALWTLTRLSGNPDSWSQRISAALESDDPLVRVHAVRIVAAQAKPDHPLVKKVREALLSDKHPLVRRAAGDGLARLKDPENIDPLLKAWQATPKADLHLAHTLKISVRDQLVGEDDRSTQAWEKANQPNRTKEETQMLALASLGVPGRKAAEFLAKNLESLSQDQENLLLAFRHIARHGQGGGWDQAEAFLNDPQGRPRALALIREWILGSRESGKPVLPASVQRASREAKIALESGKTDQVDQALALIGELRLVDSAPALVSIVTSKSSPDGQRALASQALLNLSTETYHPTLLNQLKDGATPLGLREQLAIQLGRIHNPPLLEKLAEALRVVPYRLQLAAAREMATNRVGGDLALKNMTEGKWPPMLIRDRVIATRIENSGLPGARERVSTLEKAVPPGDNRTDNLIRARIDGYAKVGPSVAAGKELFTKHCANCHQMAGAGSKVGPGLDGIGARGLERLCEDILDPSRNVDQAFRQSLVALKSGQVHTGLVTRAEGNLVVLVDQTGKEVTVDKGNIEEQKVTNLSPMPANFADSLNEKEFADLMAYLLSQKVAPATSPKP